MAWEKRGTSGRRYYYRSIRGPDGRVRKRYLGTGFAAEKAARQVAENRAEREAERARIREEIGRTEMPQKLTDTIEDSSQLMLEAMLLASGFHRHNYGPWRRRRGIKQLVKGTDAG